MSFKNATIFKVGATNDEYQKREHERGHPLFAMSSSSLKEFGHCPARWFAGYESPDSPAKTWGSLIDCLATSPDDFENRFAIQPAQYKSADGDMKDWNGNATVCKKWKRDHEGMDIISDATFKKASLAVARLNNDPIIKSWLDACERQVWVKAEWHDEPTGRVVPVQCLIDFVPRLDSEFPKCLGDLKCVRSAGIIPFQRQVYQMGWHVQAAFNTDLYLAARNEDRNTWCFIIQENYEPFQPAKRMLSEAFVDIGRAMYRKHLSNYAQCLKHGRWPGYDDHDEAIQSWTLVQPEPWMESAELFATKYEFDEPEADDAPPEVEDYLH